MPAPQVNPGFNIANVFRQQPTTQVTPQNPQGGGQGNPNPTAPNSGGMPNNPQNSGAGAGTGDGNPELPDLSGGGTGNPKKESSPLDGFADLFTIDPKAEPKKNPLAEKLFNLDPKKLSDSASRMNFVSAIPKELLQKAAAGNDPDALAAVINHAGQASFQLVTQMFVGMMENGFQKNNGRFDSVLSDRFRDFSVRNSRPENAVLNHSAVQPIVEALKTQFASKHPELSAAEVTKKAEDYFLAVHGEIGKTQKPTTDATGGSGAAKETDFTAFLQ